VLLRGHDVMILTLRLSGIVVANVQVTVPVDSGSAAGRGPSISLWRSIPRCRRCHSYYSLPPDLLLFIPSLHCPGDLAVQLHWGTRVSEHAMCRVLSTGTIPGQQEAGAYERTARCVLHVEVEALPLSRRTDRVRRCAHSVRMFAAWLLMRQTVGNQYVLNF
jgi:hypothetical protein